MSCVNWFRLIVVVLFVIIGFLVKVVVIFFGKLLVFKIIEFVKLLFGFKLKVRFEGLYNKNFFVFVNNLKL